MDVHVLQHEQHETPGHIADWAAMTGHELIVINARSRDFPKPNSIDFLIALGGALNVDEVEDHPWLVHEKDFIGQVVAGTAPVLGICLGSQLLAETLGAEVRLNPVPEIGWHHVEFDQVSMLQAGLSHLLTPPVCLEWHSQTFDIPENAIHLGSSQYCVNQAFISSGRHVGLQFHPEWTSEILNQVAAVEYTQGNGENIHFVEDILAGDTRLARPFLFGLLDHLIAQAESK